MQCNVLWNLQKLSWLSVKSERQAIKSLTEQQKLVLHNQEKPAAVSKSQTPLGGSVLLYILSGIKALFLGTQLAPSSWISSTLKQIYSKNKTMQMGGLTQDRKMEFVTFSSSVWRRFSNDSFKKVCSDHTKNILTTREIKEILSNISSNIWDVTRVNFKAKKGAL